MSSFSAPRLRLPSAWLLGLLVFGVLAGRFSPNWYQIAAEFQAAHESVNEGIDRRAVKAAFQQTLATTRGVYVGRQVEDLTAQIDDPNHKIVRWRLLFPALGHFAGLPIWGVWMLAPLGCLVLVVYVTSLGERVAGTSMRGRAEATFVAVVVGSTAPFFASMGWLGYYDAWLAVALVAVAFGPTRWVMAVACILAPWIDERMVIGLPLALAVRWARTTALDWRLVSWFRREALVPFLLVAGFSVVRISLGGMSGSQTVGEYLRAFVYGRDLFGIRTWWGALEGLRMGWLLVLVLVGFVLRDVSQKREIDLRLCWVLFASVATAAVGLLTALDFSRSMVLLLPVVLFAWSKLSGNSWWHRYWVGPTLAFAAVVLPANHVVSRFVVPVDNCWSGSHCLIEAFSGLGRIYGKGEGVAKDRLVALRWYRKAAELGTTRERYNLGVLLEAGERVPQDYREAAEWYRRAAEEGFAPAQSNLAVLYMRGQGVRHDEREALRLIQAAADRGHDLAQNNLGILYAGGHGLPKDETEAAIWYRKAARQGNAKAQLNLGNCYASGRGVSKDRMQAIAWLQKAARQGDPQAQTNLGLLYLGGDEEAAEEIEGLAWLYVGAGAGNAAAREYKAGVESRLGPKRCLEAQERSRELLRLVQEASTPQRTP